MYSVGVEKFRLTMSSPLGKLKIARRNVGEEHCLQQAARQAVGHHSPKGGDRMPITLTFHLFGITVQIRLTKKSNNRHSAK